MGKVKSKTSSKTWSCSHGCDVSQSICEHLEKELPQLVNTLSRARLYEYYGHLDRDREPSFDELSNNMIKDLMAFGFNREDCEMILDRFFSDLSLEEITKKYRFVSVSSFKYYLKNHLQPRLEKTLRKLYPEGGLD